MGANKRTLKPYRPLFELIFSKEGRVKGGIENPPRIPEDLELVVGARFVEELRNRLGITLAGLEKAQEEPADLTASDSDGRPVLIQVVEAVDPVRIRLRQQRWDYAAAIQSSSSGRLAGFRITFTDGGGSPFLPSLRSSKGRSTLSEIGRHLETLVEQAISRPGQRVVVQNLSLSQSSAEISVAIRKTSEDGLSISWGGGRSYGPGEIPTHFSAAVEQKVKMHYTKPGSQFWLLAYSTDTLVTPEAPDVTRAWQTLERATHPFDRVWAMSLQVSGTLTTEVWPRTGNPPDVAALAREDSAKWRIEFLPEDSDSLRIAAGLGKPPRDGSA